ALSRVLLYEIYTRYMLNFSGFNTTLNPYGNAQLIAGVIRWAAQGGWAWFLSSILKRGRRGHLSKGQFFICLVMPLLSLVMMMSFLTLSDYYASWNGYLLVLVNVLLLLFMNIFVVYFYITAAQSNEAEKKSRLYRQKEMLVYQHYQKLEESYRQSRKIVHDVKNHIQALGKLYEEGQTEEAEKYKEEVFHLLNQNNHAWYTENRMLNIILNEKLCHENLRDARLELDIEENCLDRIQEIDITTIFANLLDNAIEAMGRDKEPEEKYLKILAKREKEFLMIQVENSKSRHPEKWEGHQGLGLENVREAIKPYEGNCTITDEEKRFQAVILIPNTVKKEEVRSK
ncbi:MAG TPA: ATP-binding protein, partial [Candidatus Blautia merdipullorum]|nr:ATP-binding protein [Candidatus Blautia merdipullorum]